MPYKMPKQALIEKYALKYALKISEIYTLYALKKCRLNKKKKS